MSADHIPQENPAQNNALPYLLVAVSAALMWILLPFYGTLLWAAVIALLSAPVYQWLLPRLGYRKTPAATLTLLFVLVIVIIPFSLLSAALASEAAQVYQRLHDGEWRPTVYMQHIFEQLPPWILNLLGRFGFSEFDDLQNELTDMLTQASQTIATQAINIGQVTFAFVLELFVSTYIAFFLIRDGDNLVTDLRHALPLAPKHKRALIHKFATVIRAIVKGNLLVATIQGALGGIAFWALGVSAALLWAVLMAFLSLLPAVGAALVWFPVAVFFFMTGEIYKGLALLAWGVLVIGLVDNLLRPILIGKDTRMPDYVVMISTLGGIAAMGINGFVIGPVIAAMFMAVWHIYVVTRQELLDSTTEK